MAHLGMSDDEMTTFIKDGFGVDSSFSAKDLFEAAELPSWLSVRTDLGLSKSAGLQLQNALLKAIEARAAPGSKRKAAEAPQALPTDGLGRPLVHGSSVVNGVCRDPGSPPKAKGGKAKAAPPMFDIAKMMSAAPHINSLVTTYLKPVQEYARQRQPDLPTYPPRPPRRLVLYLPTYPEGLSKHWTYVL